VSRFLVLQGCPSLGEILTSHANQSLFVAFDRFLTSAGSHSATLYTGQVAASKSKLATGQQVQLETGLVEYRDLDHGRVLASL